MAFALHHGRGPEPDGLAAAHSRQSQTPTEDGGDRRDLCQHGKKEHDAVTADNGTRVRIDCQATVRIGEVSRGGLTRGETQACDHDLGLHEQDMPCGIVEEESGPWTIPFGRSYQTRACIVDALEAWWAA